MNIEKIQINGHYVWVDKNAEIKEGDWCMSLKDRLGIKSDEFMKSLSPFKSVKNFKPIKYVAKIIAASPELNLEGVPTYVKWLADIDSKNHYKDQSDYWAIGYDSFKRGYQTAEKELPTWDDVRKAIQLAQFDDDGAIVPMSEDEIIEQLKQDKK